MNSNDINLLHSVAEVLLQMDDKCAMVKILECISSLISEFLVKKRSELDVLLSEANNE